MEIEEGVNTLRDLHNSLYDIRKPNSLIVNYYYYYYYYCYYLRRSIDVKFGSSIMHVQVCAAPQIFSKQQMSPFELSSCCSFHVFSYFFAWFLLSKRVKCLPFTVGPNHPSNVAFRLSLDFFGKSCTKLYRQPSKSKLINLRRFLTCDVKF